MSRYERTPLTLVGGRVLHRISNEDRLYGFVEVIHPDGEALVWTQVGLDHFLPTTHFFPGFVSAARALIEGLV